MLSLRFTLSLIALGLSFLLWIYCGWIIGVVCTILCIYVCVAIKLLDGIRSLPWNSPEAFIRWKNNNDTNQSQHYPTLLCLGDSLTRGYVSADFTTEIASKVKTMKRYDSDQNVWAAAESVCASSDPEKTNNSCDEAFKYPLHVVNAGYNYVPSLVLLRDKMHHVNDVCPDYVFVLIGTNDLLSIYHTKFQKEIAKFNSIDMNILTMKNLEQNIKDVIRFLYDSSPTVQIGISTIPPLGEDLNSVANRLVQQANIMIRQTVSCLNDDRISIIDIYDGMEILLLKHNQRRFIPTISIDYYLILFMVVCPIQRILSFLMYYFSPNIRWWNLLSYCIGNTLSHDGVHFNEAARDVVVTSVMYWLKEKNVKKLLATNTKKL